ncbi:hypothetical protein [Dyadobacter psychrotolerans]|uniref:Uncharacterized protein n=1 Tax=Dyadobacter psychrotolerans TaxID=2541721 RepID=A0A4R5DRR3_9BACT|nr:hypothetical protein [Dyadobacter psychrotolerans]TDE17136.1 hypothetical protein E0F88_04330 [Dyadobacter psychrotolerans]
MLIIVFIVSLSFIILGQAGNKWFSLSVFSQKLFAVLGQMGIGFFAGFAAYASANHTLIGFLTGFPAH